MAPSTAPVRAARMTGPLISPTARFRPRSAIERGPDEEAHPMDTSFSHWPVSRGRPSESPLRRPAGDFEPIPGAAEEGPRRSRIGISRLPRRIGPLLMGFIVPPCLTISGPPGDATLTRRMWGSGTSLSRLSISDDDLLLENSFVAPDAALADVPAALRAPADSTPGAARSDGDARRTDVREGVRDVVHHQRLFSTGGATPPWATNKRGISDGAVGERSRNGSGGRCGRR
jgi:hypothetical protein